MSDNTELKRLAEHHLWLGHAYTVATPSAVLALIAENERLEIERAELWRGKRDVEATRDTKSAVIAELKAEIAGLKTGYEAYERVNAELKAEIESLRKARVPSGLYRELVALRELRDQAKAYVDGYLLDEVEDIECCVSADQHLSASALSVRLMDAFEARRDAAKGEQS
nr:MAG TPA: Ead/Ea22-like protein [Caudoviricetes sp.]DAK77146.1 MAG TPA: Ead/Ea22-like protein [Caudoviricetes sp.]